MHNDCQGSTRVSFVNQTRFIRGKSAMSGVWQEGYNKNGHDGCQYAYSGRVYLNKHWEDSDALFIASMITAETSEGEGASFIAE